MLPLNEEQAAAKTDETPTWALNAGRRPVRSARTPARIPLTAEAIRASEPLVSEHSLW